MNVCGVTFGGYLTKILSFKTGNLLNNSKIHLLSEGTVSCDVKDNPIGTRWDSTFRVFVFDTKLYLTNQTLIEYHNGKGDVL